MNVGNKNWVLLFIPIIVVEKWASVVTFHCAGQLDCFAYEIETLLLGH